MHDAPPPPPPPAEPTQPADADTTPPSALPRRAITTMGFVQVVSIVLLVIWAYWWTYSLMKGRLPTPPRLSFHVWPSLGVDFSGSYLAVRHFLNGGNPYVEEFGDFRGTYAYPPAALAFHLWTYLVPFGAAIAIWCAYIATVATIGAHVALRIRRALKLERVPYAFALIAVLGSTPVVFAMERGNCDALVLMLILLMIPALRRTGWLSDATLGFLAGLAAWVKIYPGLLVFAFIFLRRSRATAFGVLAMILIAVIPLPATRWFFHNTTTAQHDRSAPLTEIVEWLRSPTFDQADIRDGDEIQAFGHSLTTYWRATFTSTRLATVPGALAAAVILFSAGLWVSLKVYRCPHRSRIAYPYLLWVATVGTFFMPFSFDYNLIYLPILALAVWSARDSMYVHLLWGPVLFLFWHPLYLPVAPFVLFLVKLMALAAVSLSLAARVDELCGTQASPIPPDLSAAPGASRPNPVVLLARSFAAINP